MNFTMATPALLFPAVSLMLLVYANRFLTVAALIRDLHAAYQAEPDRGLIEQIRTLRARLKLIRNMQGLAIASFFLCVLCMFVFFGGNRELAQWIFGASLLLLLGSLGVSFREIQISVNALDLHLRDLDGGKS